MLLPRVYASIVSIVFPLHVPLLAPVAVVRHRPLREVNSRWWWGTCQNGWKMMKNGARWTESATQRVKTPAKRNEASERRPPADDDYLRELVVGWGPVSQVSRSLNYVGVSFWLNVY